MLHRNSEYGSIVSSMLNASGYDWGSMCRVNTKIGGRAFSTFAQSFQTLCQTSKACKAHPHILKQILSTGLLVKVHFRNF